MKIKTLLSLYITFLKIGAFTLGGGYAMLSIIQREVVDVKKWATDEEMADYLTIGQSLPGVIAINTATAVGGHVCGLLGSVIATLGIITPSFVIITLIAMFFKNIRDAAIVMAAFKGLRAAVVALMFSAVFRLFKTNVKNKFQWTACILSAVLLYFAKVLPQYVIFGAIFVGIIITLAKGRRC